METGEGRDCDGGDIITATCEPVLQKPANKLLPFSVHQGCLYVNMFFFSVVFTYLHIYIYYICDLCKHLCNHVLVKNC
jgi:hypothetical protein